MSYPFARAANVYPTDARLVTLIDLEPEMCRWPVGEPRDPALRYCGADCVASIPGESAPLHPYCPCHMKLGTQPGTRMKMRRAAPFRCAPAGDREPDLTQVFR